MKNRIKKLGLQYIDVAAIMESSPAAITRMFYNNITIKTLMMFERALQTEFLHYDKD